jgi:hypothetical protein
VLGYTRGLVQSAFKQYLDERFPVAPYVLLVGAMVAAATASAVYDVGSVPFGYRQLLVLMSLMAGFFHLRVFDEHKDYDKDLQAHPDRVLSRGLITLAQLRKAGYVAIAVEIGIGLVLGWHALFWTLAFIGFSVLMRYEFFVPDWLNERVVLYAISHNPIVALMMIFASVGALENTQFTPGLLWFLGVATFTSLGFEVGRKVRAPADEREGQDTYSNALGPNRAAILIIVVELFAVAFTLPLLRTLAAQLVVVGLGALMMIVPILYARSAAGGDSRATASLGKGVENATTLGALGIYLAITVDVALAQGVVWS